MKHLNLSSGLKTLGLLLALSGSASAAWMAHGQKSVSFRAVGPGGLSFVGAGSELSVREQGNRLAIVVGLGGFKTGIDLRDRHMREKYLETTKYPTASLVVDKSRLVAPTNGADVDGALSLHGVTKTVRVHYTATGEARQFHIEGTFRVNMKDFGINVPSYLGVTVKPDVLVSAKFVAIDR